MRSTCLTVMLLVLLFSPCLGESKGVRGALPQDAAVPPTHLMHASARYSTGVLQIKIPFFDEPEVSSLWGPSFEWIGLRFAAVKEGNSIGWVSYRDQDGQIIHSGPLKASSPSQSPWYHDFMPGRQEKVDPFGPYLSTAAETAAGFVGLQGPLGNTYPDGVMTIVFSGEVFNEDPRTPKEIGVSCCNSPWIARLPVSSSYQQYMNYIAFGKAGAAVVNQILIATNLTSEPCLLKLEILDRGGAAVRQLSVPVQGDSVARHSLIDLYNQQVPADAAQEPPPLLLGSAWVAAVKDIESGEIDPNAEFALGTVYQILSGGTLLGEGGLAVAEPSCYNIVPVHKSSTGEDTGLAIGCPSSVGAHSIVMSLVDENDVEIATTEGLFLQPNATESQFFWQYFDSLPEGFTDFTGSLRITSSSGIAVTALNTVNGFVVSSLPAGTLKP